MQLFFLRHGLADWPEWDTARDHERPLTDAGMAKLKEEARRIEGLGVRPDAIVTSRLVRARQTADIVAKQLRVEVAEDITLAPGFNAKKLGDVLGRHADAGAILTSGPFGPGRSG